MDTGLWSADWAEQVGATPWVWTAVLVGAMVAGLVLWLLGGRLAKAGTVLAGFVVGGLAVTAVAVGFASESGVGPWVLVAGVGGAIAGALLAWLLFRLWMGVMAAGVLALAVPAAVIIWNPSSVETSLSNDDVAEVVEEDATSLVDSIAATVNEGLSEAFSEETLAEAIAEGVAEGGDGEAGVEPSALVDAEKVQAVAIEQARRVWDVLKAAWDREMARLGGWWDGLPTGTRTTVIGGSAIGGVLGLVLGLLLPKLMAALQTALVGALLLFFPAGILVHAYLVGPVSEALEGTDVETSDAGVAGLAAYWPSSPRAMLLALGLITLLGLVLQCTVFRKKADS
ncbi:MAG: hypothetical protein AAF916_06350 [Planctomycetota bacterium]